MEKEYLIRQNTLARDVQNEKNLKGVYERIASESRMPSIY